MSEPAHSDDWHISDAHMTEFHQREAWQLEPEPPEPPPIYVRAGFEASTYGRTMTAFGETEEGARTRLESRIHGFEHGCAITQCDEAMRLWRLIPDGWKDVVA